MKKAYLIKSLCEAKACWETISKLWRGAMESGVPLYVEIQTGKATRSNEQNRLYWVMLRHIAETAWIEGKQYTSEVWHEYFKRRFIGIDDLPGGGTMASSSAKLSVEAFSRYMDDVQAIAAVELGVTWDN